MNNAIQTVASTNDAALNARGLLALSRAVAGFDAERAQEILSDAYTVAEQIGYADALHGRATPLQFAGESVLLQGYDRGREEWTADDARYEEQASFADYVAPEWVGDWHMDMDGVYETRPSVVKRGANFISRLEVSRFGGDCEPSDGESRPSLAAAIEEAERMDAEWHATE